MKNCRLQLGSYRIRDQRLATARQSAQTTGEIYRITNQRVFETARRSDVTDKGVSEIDANARMQHRPACRSPSHVERMQLIMHILRGTHRAVRIIIGGNRRAPVGHDGIANKLVQRAVMPEHALHHRSKIFIELRSHLIGRQTLRNFGEAAHVAEQDDHSPPYAAKRNVTGRVGNVFGQLRGEIPFEVFTHSRRVAKPQRGLFALKRRGRYACIRHQKIEIRVGEGVGVAQVVA